MPRIVCRTSAKLLLGAACLALLAGCVDKSPDTQLDWGVYNHGWPDSGPVDAPTASDSGNTQGSDTQYAQKDPSFQVAQNSDNDPTPPPPANYHAPDQDSVQVSTLDSVPKNNGLPTEEEYANAPIHREKTTGTEPASQQQAPRSLSKPGHYLAREAAREEASRRGVRTGQTPTHKKPVEVPATPAPVPRDTAHNAHLTRQSLRASTGTPDFRWPLRGKILNQFGGKANGMENDGINIATREGDPIHAAAAGVVEYAGNGIAGYGNLILIRHKGDYFTAYAHADKLNVRKGDSIRSGQVIGYAGQSGDVKVPQLHFEIRHGKTPLNPMRFLQGSGRS